MEAQNVSYWHKTAEKLSYQKLEGNIDVDTLIIGAGITGITTAYSLAIKGKKSVVIEAGDICDGTTGNTTGKITIQHDIIYKDVISKYGEEFAKKYAKSQTKAIDFVRDVVEKEKIDCNLVNNTAYIYTTVEKEKKKIQKEHEAALKLGIDSVLFGDTNFPPNSLIMVGFKNQAVFHAVKYVNELSKKAIEKGAQIYCSTKAIKIEDGDIITIHCENDITIKAKHLVMATQYPIYDGPNIFYTRLYAKRAYGIAVLPERDWPDGSYINIEDPSRSIRTHIEDGKKILIVVGEGHSTGRKEDEIEEHFNNLIKFADEIAGVKEVLAKWSAQDYETPDHVPYIGRISSKSNIYVASGYRKWGLSTGSLAGNMISDLIINGKCDYESIYSKAREDYSSSPIKTTTEVVGSVIELIKSKIESIEDVDNLKQGEGRVIKYDGTRAGIYRDNEDNITILDITCTHMGTELNFNTLEKTWDCPAHGGRYNIDGKLLEGPPKNSLEILYKGNYRDFIKDN
jgi:glycine/D-amino acid oxidase-like deaminating enzyme/nitrite reductase/ring-hydroxylating ferredoxin subunit